MAMHRVLVEQTLINSDDENDQVNVTKRIDLPFIPKVGMSLGFAANSQLSGDRDAIMDVMYHVPSRTFHVAIEPVHLGFTSDDPAVKDWASDGWQLDIELYATVEELRKNVDLSFPGHKVVGVILGYAFLSQSELFYLTLTGTAHHVYEPDQLPKDKPKRVASSPGK